jgi:hypothetical protein
MVDEPRIPVDGFIFIWMSIMRCRYKRKEKKVRKIESLTLMKI